jgi:hypothetical protein
MDLFNFLSLHPHAFFIELFPFIYPPTKSGVILCEFFPLKILCEFQLSPLMTVIIESFCKICGSTCDLTSVKNSWWNL